MVGAVLVKAGRVISEGWHHGAGKPHAEIEALEAARVHGISIRGAELFVTLEPCPTYGRTPPCTKAIIRSGIKRVIVGATDPNPLHFGKGLAQLRAAGIHVVTGVLEDECIRLNEAFNHWIVHRTPFVTVKAAMTLDGKIATAAGESKWITGPKARAFGMKLRQGADAVVIGVGTVLADDPRLTVRFAQGRVAVRQPRRIVLDSTGRIPLTAHVLTDEHAELTTVVMSESASEKRVNELARRVRVMQVPGLNNNKGGPVRLDLSSLLRQLGNEEVTNLLVEGGGEANASFLFSGLTHRVAFFYAPMVLGGKNARRSVGGNGADSLCAALRLSEVMWRKVGPDLLLLARVQQHRHQNAN
jgi:diaminohydroxyphosphoribosylaminopyrimidine deaminase/5-amino-6-(5-phosphoribosylamino)uracil reductase